MNDKARPRPILPQDYYRAQEVMNLLRISKRRPTSEGKRRRSTASQNLPRGETGIDL